MTAPVLTRAQAAELACRLLSSYAGPDHPALIAKGDASFGMVEIRILLDAIYGGPPAADDELVTFDRVRALDSPAEAAKLAKWDADRKALARAITEQARKDHEARLKRFEAVNGPGVLTVDPDDLAALLRDIS